MSTRSSILVVGYGAAYAAELHRGVRRRAVGVLLHLGLSGFALSTAVAVALRPLPVVELRAGEGVCPPAPPTPVGAWSRVQVEAWLREWVELLLVQDSLQVERRLSRAFRRMTPKLRTRLQGSASLARHFAGVKARNLRGELERLQVSCGDGQPFLPDTAPWHCVLWGMARYRPAVGPLPEGQKPHEGYFFAKVALTPGEASLYNPLGLLADVFLPREASTEVELQQILAQEGAR